ncbi:MAG: hypothetical protein KIH08_01690, partial [Candidatus Freyarchaeota archaeon]|nr:hypothetical protein [Candidatus Jordarchaeia archaeon]
ERGECHKGAQTLHLTTTTNSVPQQKLDPTKYTLAFWRRKNNSYTVKKLLPLSLGGNFQGKYFRCYRP